MSNFKYDIVSEIEANGETEANIEKVLVIGGLDLVWDNQLKEYKTDPRARDIVCGDYSWQEIGEKFNYTYDSGYGSMDCHVIYIWTPKYIYYIEEYDGSTTVASIPRNY